MQISDINILSNGIAIPHVGCGTWTYDDATAETNVRMAIDAGYRLVDTAEYYGNETGVGRAVRGCGIHRSELMVTSKLWKSNCSYEKAKESFFRSLDRFGLDYLDVYLIHWPVVEKDDPAWRERNAETWHALEELYEEGLIRAIGVSNFMPRHLQPLMEMAKICPMIDQVEFHPGFAQFEIRDFCRNAGIVMQAWSPFGRGEVFDNSVVREIAAVYGVSPAQVCLRWLLQNGLNPVTKSANPQRLRQNLEIGGFELSDADMKRMDEIEFFGRLGYNPETVKLG